jgi:hypothetical protein
MDSRLSNPRTADEARTALYELFRSDRHDKAARRQASIARRILNEEAQKESARLYAIIRTIKSLRRLQAQKKSGAPEGQVNGKL